MNMRIVKQFDNTCLSYTGDRGLDKMQLLKTLVEMKEKLMLKHIVSVVDLCDILHIERTYEDFLYGWDDPEDMTIFFMEDTRYMKYDIVMYAYDLKELKEKKEKKDGSK